jgi:hypothetical protein
MIVAGEEFAHLGRLYRLAGLDDAPVTGGDAAHVQFFTEYGFAESLYGAEDDRFSDAPIGKDTPDVVIFSTEPRPRMLAIEAKVYDRPSKAQLVAQLTVQRALVTYLAQKLSVADEDCAHIALLPRDLGIDGAGLGTPVVFWEDLLSVFEDVAPVYWAGLLRVALERYDELVAKTQPFRVNADTIMTGAESRPGLGRTFYRERVTSAPRFAAGAYGCPTLNDEFPRRPEATGGQVGGCSGGSSWGWPCS